MKLPIIVLLIAAALYLLPYVRVLFKRIALYFRMRALCRQRGMTFIPSHPLWFLAPNSSVGADFYIETRDSVLAVKLFAVRGFRTSLILDENGTYRIRHYLGFRSVTPDKRPYDSSPHPFPATGFHFAYRDEWSSKLFRQILLLNPTSQGVYVSNNSNERTVWGNGNIETVRGMEIYTLSRLLGELRAPDADGVIENY